MEVADRLNVHLSDSTIVLLPFGLDVACVFWWIRSWKN